MFGLLILVLVLWAAYRILISGPGSNKSFVEYYNDHNAVRKDIQDKGGIHKVEGENIRQLENIGYEVDEYYENAVELVKTTDRRRSKVTLTHDHTGKKLISVSYHKRGQGEVLSFKKMVYEDEGAVESLHRHVDSFIDSSRSSTDEGQLKRHFSISTDESASEDTERSKPEVSSNEASADLEADSRETETTLGHRDGNPTILAEDFLDQYTVLSPSQMSRLRNGEKIILNDVELGQKISHKNSGDSRVETLLFNAFSAESADALDDIAYFNDQDKAEVRWDEVADIPNTSASYTVWQRDLPKAYQQRITEGQTAKVAVNLDHSPDGSEKLEVSNFVVEKFIEKKVRRGPDGNSTVLAKDFVNQYTMLSPSQMSRLRDGEKITLESVQLSQILDHKTSEDIRARTFLFSVVPAEAADALNEITYHNSEDKPELAWSDIANLDYSTAADYTCWQRDGSLPDQKHMTPGMKAKVNIEIGEPTDDSEPIRATNFIRKKETDAREKNSSEPDEATSEINR